MSPNLKLSACCGIVFFLYSFALIAEEKYTTESVSIPCHSDVGERQHCPADTAAGVILLSNPPSTNCILGKTWGYDDEGVWVEGGCSGHFMVSRAEAETDPEAVAEAAKLDTKSVRNQYEQWGYFSPGEGILLGRSELGEASFSGYGLVRYINQMPAEQTFTDHLGNEHDVDARQDIYSQRVMLSINGWVADPKMVYNFIWWTVNSTDQDAIFANLGYRFHKKFNLYAGINGNPGSRTININNEIGILFYDPELSGKSMDDFDQQINKVAFSVELVTDADGKESLRWVGQEDGKEVIFYDEPYVGFWKKLAVKVMRVLPVDFML